MYYGNSRPLKESGDSSISEQVDTEHRSSSCQPGNHVLLVEDEEHLLFSYSLSLQMLGYKVIAASNGQEALEKLCQSTGRINLMILDVSLPYMSGLELLDIVRRTETSTPAIVISGHGDGFGIRAESKRLNALFMPKPFSMQELERAILSLSQEGTSKMEANPDPVSHAYNTAPWPAPPKSAT